MILLVEDNPSARKLLVQALADAGYMEVIATGNGGAALQCVDLCRFDLIITDLELPDASGFEIISHAHRRWPDLPIILVTGYLAPEIARSLDGAVEYMAKPINLDRLIESVMKCVGDSTGKPVEQQPKYISATLPEARRT